MAPVLVNPNAGLPKRRGSILRSLAVVRLVAANGLNDLRRCCHFLRVSRSPRHGHHGQQAENHRRSQHDELKI